MRLQLQVCIRAKWIEPVPNRSDCTAVLVAITSAPCNLEESAENKSYQQQSLTKAIVSLSSNE